MQGFINFFKEAKSQNIATAFLTQYPFLFNQFNRTEETKEVCSSYVNFFYLKAAKQLRKVQILLVSFIWVIKSPNILL